VQRRAREVALRQRVGQGTRGFDDAAGLEDALFQELQNAGCRPRAARVIAKRLRGGTGPAARRPSEADIELTLSGVDAEGDVAEQIEERLLLAWLLLGKYAEIGHVDLGDVSIRFVAPTPYADQQRGRDLAQFWSGRLESAQLLLGSMNR
jgi:hypothetical protein